MYIYIYTYIGGRERREGPVQGGGAGGGRRAHRAGHRKGTNGVSTNGVTANSVFLDRGTFWVLPLTTLVFAKVPGRTFSPNLSKLITFAAAPLVLTPFVRNQKVANDEKYIKQVSDQLAEKKEEWKDRQVLVIIDNVSSMIIIIIIIIIIMILVVL